MIGAKLSLGVLLEPPLCGGLDGVAAGNSVAIVFNGGVPPDGIAPGTDGLDLPATEPTVWKRGEVVEVAWAILANHGGGYSWRLCSKNGEVSEECFQQNVLRFHGESSWLQNGSSVERQSLPRVTVSEGTHPVGSEWARNPIPGCYYCDQSACGSLLPNVTDCYIDDNVTFCGGKEWEEVEHCAENCSLFGPDYPEDGGTPCTTPQFEEPIPGVSGSATLPWNILDTVVVPSDLESGEYILGFRWDSEQSAQIWQDCADIRIVDSLLHV